MRIDILTLFPGMFRGPLDESIVGRARQAGLLDIAVTDIRDYALDKHRITDDYGFGGGPGMVMKPEPVFDAVEDALRRGREAGVKHSRVVLMCPQGERFTQAKAEELSEAGHLVLICGHYEGVDERIRQALATDEVSIGDYVLTGGEPAAIVVLDAVVRLIPGVLGKESSTVEESFSDGLLEYPQYTRPREYRGMEVPEVLVSGNHELVRIWRRKESLRRTLQRRPELLAGASLNDEDRKLLAELFEEMKEERESPSDGSGREA